MKIEQVKLLSPIDRLCYWIRERETIRIEKECGAPKPWTYDEILQRYRFCNVRRMDDKVSQWLLKNWYEPHFDHTNMLYACSLARFFNKPESLALITDLVFRQGPPAWANIKKTLRRHRDNGETVFNGAYVVRGNDGIDKIECVVDYYVKPLVKVGYVDSMSMQCSHAVLNTCYGFGSFMAGQVVADLRWAVGGAWADKKSWAPMGPGSKRGMNRLLSRDIKHGMSQEEFLEHLHDMIGECHQRLPNSITDRLEAIDWQNCCCEISKYEKALWDEGKPKQNYPGA